MTRAGIGVEPSTYLGYGITFLVITFLVNLKRDNKNTPCQIKSSVLAGCCSSMIKYSHSTVSHTIYTFGLVHQQKKAPDLDHQLLLL